LDRSYRLNGIQGKWFLDKYMLLCGGDGRHLFGMLGLGRGHDDSHEIGIAQRIGKVGGDWNAQVFGVIRSVRCGSRDAAHEGDLIAFALDGID
jgi:hypothetical protein